MLKYTQITIIMTTITTAKTPKVKTTIDKEKQSW
jgi:hypothetical protein